MDENENTDQVQIVSHFHENADTLEDIPQNLKETKDYRQTEKIFGLRKHVTFLNGLNPEDQLWKRIETQIKPPVLFQHWMRYAAIIILSFTLGSLLIYFSGISKHETAIASISSPRGQITSLKLFDGSTVWLNSESTIKYSSDFNTGNREVYVEGEAYFEVTYDEKNPFIVNLENSQVKVHGTSFNVKAYPGSDQVEAVLMEGKIEFIANNRSVLLKPHERIVLSSRQGTIVKDQIDIEKTLAWKKGKYYYSNEKLSTIIGQLQRWYDIEFVFNENELSLYTFTGVINHEKSIEYNLQLIELTNKINVEFKNEKIVITGK
jgi:ferric-dicitrate binding protein FerR (iron transport regulator)